MKQKVEDAKLMRIAKISVFSEDQPLQRYKEDLIVREVEVRIKVDGKIHTRLFCLPSHFEELAIGYLKSKGLDPSHISSIEVEEVNPEIYEILVCTITISIFLDNSSSFVFIAIPSKSGLGMNFIFLYLNVLIIAAG